MDEIDIKIYIPHQLYPELRFFISMVESLLQQEYK